MKDQSTALATLIGYLALLMWSCSPALASSVKGIPTFEVVSVAFGTSFTISLIIFTLKKEWHKLKQPLILWIIGIIGIYCNDVLYIAAFKYTPAAQVDVINYLWPIFVILFALFLPKEKLSLKHLAAAFLGLSATYILVTGGHGFAGFHPQYLIGYVLALAEAIIWGVYTIVARHYRNTPTAIIGMYCGFGMLVSMITQHHLGTYVTPSSAQWLVMIVMGLSAQGLAYFCWDFGIKRGNFKLLSILAYGNPILSILILFILGMTKLTLALFFACLLVSIAALIGSNTKLVPNTK